jgi:hypothetical protein
MIAKDLLFFRWEFNIERGLLVRMKRAYRKREEKNVMHGDAFL